MPERRKKSQIEFTRTIHGHEIPFYRMSLDSGGRVLVPKHLRRINGQNHHGWQVAIRRRGIANVTRFISDSQDTPAGSLDRAVSELSRVLADIPPEKNTALKMSEPKNKLISTGMPGVRLHWRMHRVAGVYQLYVEARAGVHSPHTSWQQYIGTEKTVTEYRIQVALSKAMKKRRMFFENELAMGKRNPYKRRSKAHRLNLDQIDAALARTKENDAAIIQEMIKERLDRYRNNKPVNGWAGVKFHSQIVEAGGQEMLLPSIISVEDGRWSVEVLLRNGHLYGDEMEMGDDPYESALELLGEAMEAMALAVSSLAERERLYGASEGFARTAVGSLSA